MTYDMCLRQDYASWKLYAWCSTESAKGDLALYFLTNSKQQSEFVPVSYFASSDYCILNTRAGAITCSMEKSFNVHFQVYVKFTSHGFVQSWCNI